MSHQNGFSNNRTEPSGSGKSDYDGDCMQKKSENVAHPQDGIKPKKALEFRALAEFATHRWDPAEAAVHR